jgi:hypothetical protein
VSTIDESGMLFAADRDSLVDSVPFCTVSFFYHFPERVGAWSREALGMQSKRKEFLMTNLELRLPVAHRIVHKIFLSIPLPPIGHTNPATVLMMPSQKVGKFGHAGRSNEQMPNHFSVSHPLEGWSPKRGASGRAIAVISPMTIVQSVGNPVSQQQNQPRLIDQLRKWHPHKSKCSCLNVFLVYR